MKALLVIDMQNDFCLPGGLLCVTMALECIPKVKKAVRAARAAGIPVFWILRQHHTSGCDVELFRQHLYKGGQGPTIADTQGAALAGGLDVHVDDYVIVKKRFSAFHNTNLSAVLRRLGVQEIIICGVQTPNCIRATAYDAIAEDVPKVVVLSDATASATPEVQEANLYDLRQVGVLTPGLDEWVASLSAFAGVLPTLSTFGWGTKS